MLREADKEECEGGKRRKNEEVEVEERGETRDGQSVVTSEEEKKEDVAVREVQAGGVI